jgi:hypothetical protein
VALFRNLLLLGAASDRRADVLRLLLRKGGDSFGLALTAGKDVEDPQYPDPRAGDAQLAEADVGVDLDAVE